MLGLCHARRKHESEFFEKINKKTQFTVLLKKNQLMGRGVFKENKVSQNLFCKKKLKKSTHFFVYKLFLK